MRANANREYRAKRSFSQNFLTDPSITERIASALELKSCDLVIEIGAGTGALTRDLALTGAQVMAIEIDRELIPWLGTQFDGSERVEIIEADILALDLIALLNDYRRTGHIKLTGNLPYRISTAILQKLITGRHMFSRMVFMFQREVVERIMARPGSGERGYLTVLNEAAFDREWLFDVPPTAFFPQPKVWSSVIRLLPKPASFADEPGFAEFLGAAFAQKRKTIANNLKLIDIEAVKIIERAGIDPKKRAETLTINEWENLYIRFKYKK